MDFTILNPDKGTVSSQLREEVDTGTVIVVFAIHVTDNSEVIALRGEQIGRIIEKCQKFNSLCEFR